MTVHAAANEAAIRHLNARLGVANLDLAVAVGNLAWKDALIADLRAQIAALEAELTQAAEQLPCELAFAQARAPKTSSTEGVS